jgi:hypothetical protein
MRRQLCFECETVFVQSGFDCVILSDADQEKDFKGLRNIQMELDKLFSQLNAEYKCNNLDCRQTVVVDQVYSGGEFIFFEIGGQYMLSTEEDEAGGQIEVDDPIEVPFVVKIRDILGNPDAANFKLRSVIFNTNDHVTAMNFYESGDDEHELLCRTYDDNKPSSSSLLKLADRFQQLNNVAVVLYQKETGTILESFSSSELSSSSSNLKYQKETGTISESFSSSELSSSSWNLEKLMQRAKDLKDIYCPYECSSIPPCSEECPLECPLSPPCLSKCLNSPMSFGTCTKSYCCSRGHMTCVDCICRFKKNNTVKAMDFLKGKLVCPTCEESVNSLSEEVYLTFPAQCDPFQDARPPLGLANRCKTVAFEDGELSVSLFRERDILPLDVRLNIDLLPFTHLPRPYKQISDDLKYHELFVSMFEARKYPRRVQVSALAKELMASTTNLLSPSLKASERIYQQYKNAEPHGFCAILTAEFMGIYANTGKWPQPLNTRSQQVKETLLENLTSVIDSDFQDHPEVEIKMFIKKLTAMRDTVHESIASRDDKCLTIKDNWLNSQELILYFSKRFPGKQTLIFHHIGNMYALEKTSFNAETCDHPKIFNCQYDCISFSGFKRFLKTKACIILSVNPAGQEYGSGHFWPYKLQEDYTCTIDSVVGRISKQLISACEETNWPKPGSINECLCVFVCVIIYSSDMSEYL